MARTVARKILDDDDEYPQKPIRNATRTLPKSPPKRRIKRKAGAAELKRLDKECALGPRPKTKRVAKDVLSTKKVSDEQNKIYQRNSTESRLLKLPPEIRNDIFGLVFGNNTIHVYSKSKSTIQLSANRKLCRSICVNDSTEAQDADEIMSTLDSSTQLGYHERHPKCKHYMSAGGRKSKHSSMNLQVLQVFRQIHNEVALMPYEQTTFSFGWVLDLEAFVEYLIPTQLNAVQKLSFVWHSFNSDKNFERRLAEQLKSLKSLTIFVQVQNGLVGVQDGHFQDTARTERLTEGVLRFQRLSVEKASVVAYNAPTLYGDQSYGAGSAPTGMLSAWGKQVEEKLKGKYEGKDDEDEEMQEDAW